MTVEQAIKILQKMPPDHLLLREDNSGGIEAVSCIKTQDVINNFPDVRSGKDSDTVEAVVIGP